MTDDDQPSPAAAAATPAGLPSALPFAVPADGRQSEAALAIARGTLRLLAAQGLAGLAEVPLPDGRRADLMAVSEQGWIWIVEIKSSVADYRADLKWPDYRASCDRLFFAVSPDFPQEILPEGVGIVVADRYGGEVIRAAPEHRLAPATRKGLVNRFARLAAFRLAALSDPAMALEAARWG